jgi:hypothetical protein
MFLRENYALTYQSALGRLGEVSNYTFFDVSNVYKEQYLSQRKNDEFSLLKFSIYMDSYIISHSRKEYDIIDLLGDVGGI